MEKIYEEKSQGKISVQTSRVGGFNLLLWLSGCSLGNGSEGDGPLRASGVLI